MLTWLLPTKYFVPVHDNSQIVCESPNTTYKLLSIHVILWIRKPVVDFHLFIINIESFRFNTYVVSYSLRTLGNNNYAKTGSTVSYMDTLVYIPKL